MAHIFVPVVDQQQRPLMPTSPSRARRWIRSGKATGVWKGGVFCVRLNVEPCARSKQHVAVGIDPGSKKEGYSIVSAAHTYLSTRLRRTRRYRKTPCRQPRRNRHHAREKIPPSTRARWQWKLRLAAFLCRLFPVSTFVVEDIKASTRAGNAGKWNRSFAPLEVGKHWFYTELQKLAPVTIKQGWETKTLREHLGLKKTSRKLAEVWEAHCVDAWTLAQSAVADNTTPDNTRLLCIAPLVWHRRQLHRLQPASGGERKPYGGTLSQGIKRGTLVKHPKWGKAYVGGTSDGKISLHEPQMGKRLTQEAKTSDCRLMKLLRWRARLVPLSTTHNPRKERALPPTA